MLFYLLNLIKAEEFSDTWLFYTFESEHFVQYRLTLDLSYKRKQKIKKIFIHTFEFCDFFF